MFIYSQRPGLVDDLLLIAKGDDDDRFVSIVFITGIDMEFFNGCGILYSKGLFYGLRVLIEP